MIYVHLLSRLDQWALHQLQRASNPILVSVCSDGTNVSSRPVRSSHCSWVLVLPSYGMSLVTCLSRPGTRRAAKAASRSACSTEVGSNRRLHQEFVSEGRPIGRMVLVCH